jgi:hypothetical protein
MIQDSGGCFSEYNIELQINFIPNANTLSGNAYDFFDLNRYVKLEFSGRYNPLNKRVVLIENNLLESRIPNTCVPCVKTYDLNWKMNGVLESLTGECKGREFGSQKSCPPYKITLLKASRSDFAVDVEQSPQLATIQKALTLQPRQKEFLQTLIVDSSDIQLDLYDNAEIDNDTVTVFLNNKLLLYRQMLREKPLTIHLNAFPDTDYELVMYADNLGTIPPNTALLVVTAGTKKYELHLSSSEEKSAAVKFRYIRKSP